MPILSDYRHLYGYKLQASAGINFLQRIWQIIPNQQNVCLIYNVLMPTPCAFSYYNL